jgi:hypothetical protein
MSRLSRGRERLRRLIDGDDVKRPACRAAAAPQAAKCAQ